MKLTEDAQVSVKQLAPGKTKRVLSEGNTVNYIAPVADEETGETDENGETVDVNENGETIDASETTDTETTDTTDTGAEPETGDAPADSEAEGTGAAQ